MSFYKKEKTRRLSDRNKAISRMSINNWVDGIPGYPVGENIC